MLPEVLKVSKFRRDTYDTFTIALNAAERGGFFFEPGQFNMLYLPGVGEVPISISGDPARPMFLWHTIREVGSVTDKLGELRRGSELGVRGPYGTPWPVRDARGRDVVLVAGGIGLAPLRPVVMHLLRKRRDFGRVVIAYGARSPQDVLYLKEIARWRARFDFQVLVTVDRPDADWLGNAGVVTKLLERADFDPGHAVAMLCGPEIMMRFAVRELIRLGMDPRDTWVSLERNMHCSVGTCGHCQLGRLFICKDGPVFRWNDVAELLAIREL